MLPNTRARILKITKNTHLIITNALFIVAVTFYLISISQKQSAEIFPYKAFVLFAMLFSITPAIISILPRFKTFEGMHVVGTYLKTTITVSDNTVNARTSEETKWDGVPIWMQVLLWIWFYGTTYLYCGIAFAIVDFVKGIAKKRPEKSEQKKPKKELSKSADRILMIIFVPIMLLLALCAISGVFCVFIFPFYILFS